MLKAKEDSAEVETRRSDLTKDQLTLTERMAYQEQVVLLDRRTSCVEVTRKKKVSRKKSVRLENHATEMTTRPESEDSRPMPSAPIKSRPGLGLVGGERSP